mmetsp:Transcript_135676/g.253518  ORF Transcript_135676/g.253518 Transcript_135676/m.253518 type:complete len:247 (-) Transcript_135676:55-795(-)
MAEGKDSVTPRGPLVHGRGRCSSHAVAEGAQVHGFLEGLLEVAQHCRRQALDMDSVHRMHMDFACALPVRYVCGQQKILDGLIVNLVKLTSILSFCFCWVLRVRSLDVREQAWQHTRVFTYCEALPTHHSVSLARASVTIRKHTYVVAFKRMVDHFLEKRIVDKLLIAVIASRIEHLIQSELLSFTFVTGKNYRLMITFYIVFRSFFMTQLGTYAGSNPDLRHLLRLLLRIFSSSRLLGPALSGRV